jgi:ABC-type phosphate/phosphonate transport system permease subunit
MISGLIKTVIWWAIIIAIVIFFLQGNTIDSPKAFFEWAENSAIDLRAFYESTFGQLDFSKINLNGEEIDTPQEAE